VAVENDYNLLVSRLNDLAETTERIRDEVQERLLQEKRDGRCPDATRWVELLTTRLPFVSGAATRLEAGGREVLRSRPGEAVFPDQPPSSRGPSTTVSGAGKGRLDPALCARD
jgi:hypothetical protein